MPLICYKPQNFSSEKMDLIAKVNLVVNKYAKQGFSLTLRQLYYVFVANDTFPDSWTYRSSSRGGIGRRATGANKWVPDVNGTKNAKPNYDKLGDLLTDARMAGLIDWNSIIDRSRGSYANQHWQRPSQILEGVVNTYAIDKWSLQENYVEVWVEKEALEDVLSQACRPLDVRFFACKGYTSISSMWEASQRLVSQVENGKHVHIIHLGDHDPSGVDMSRDIEDRLTKFVFHTQAGREHFNLHRIALNMNQIQDYNPPPNWAKTTDVRFKKYQQQFGDESWELDALEPEVLVELISRHIKSLRDDALWEESLSLERRGKGTLQSICMYFPDVVKFLRERRKQDDSLVVCIGCGATQANPKCLCHGHSPISQL